MRLLFSVLLFCLLAGCGSSKKETELEIKKADLEILKAYSNEDFVNLNKLSTSENKTLFNKIIKEGKDPSVFKAWKNEAFGIKEWWNGKDDSLEVIFDNKTDEALVRFMSIPITNEVSALHLIRENGIWRFSSLKNMTRGIWIELREYQIVYF